MKLYILYSIVKLSLSYRLVDETQAELAGSMMSMFMTIGLAAGSGLSYGIAVVSTSHINFPFIISLNYSCLQGTVQYVPQCCL